MWASPQDSVCGILMTWRLASPQSRWFRKANWKLQCLSWLVLKSHSALRTMYTLHRSVLFSVVFSTNNGGGVLWVPSWRLTSTIWFILPLPWKVAYIYSYIIFSACFPLVEFEGVKVKNWLLEKDPDAGKDWRQDERGWERMVGWHHRLNGHEFKRAPGVGDGQGSLACCSPWSRKDSDMTERLN